MPSSPIPLNANAAIIRDSAVEVDDDFGIRYEMSGLLVEGIDHSSKRDMIEHKNHNNTTVLTLASNPSYSMSVTASVTLTDSIFNNHPGNVIERGLITNYHPAVAFTFPNGGHFSYGDPTMSAKPGDLFALKFNLNLRYVPTERLASAALPWTAA